MSPKTPQASRNKIPVGKGRVTKSFKKKGKLNNRLLRRISDSSFNVANLSRTKMSTPISVQGSKRKRKRSVKTAASASPRLGVKRTRLENKNKQSALPTGAPLVMNEVNTPRRRRRLNNQFSASESPKLCANNNLQNDKNVAVAPVPETCAQGRLAAASDEPAVAQRCPESQRSRLPAGNQVTKSPQLLAHLFRNDYVGLGPVAAETVSRVVQPDPELPPGKVNGPRVVSPPAAATAISHKPVKDECDDVIIIEDDESRDDVVVEEKKTEIENVGEELLKALSSDDKEEGDLDATLVPEPAKDAQEEWHNNADKLIETITIDESGRESPDSDSIMIVHEEVSPAASPSDESVQILASKYYTTSAPMDFIPLDTRGIVVTVNNKKKSNKKKLSNKKRNNEQRPPGRQEPFVPNMEPDINFVERGMSSQVVRFTGVRQNQGRSGAPAEPPLQPPSKGATLYSNEERLDKGLRPIVIDGSNIAFAHGLNKFSVKGIEMVVNYFKNRNHKTVVAFLPQHRLNENRLVLSKMEKEGNVVFTPSRKAGGNRISSYDDRMILDYATDKGGIVITRDNYRDIYEEGEKYRETIKNRLLMPTFVGDTVMFPDDPLGRSGPRLDQFLSF